ncbi:MAG: hypothetical protein VX435_02515 [Planctomycetota bacterium]|nr:hypothetical protein [Planctomycetota bacterium]
MKIAPYEWLVIPRDLLRKRSTVLRHPGDCEPVDLIQLTMGEPDVVLRWRVVVTHDWSVAPQVTGHSGLGDYSRIAHNLPAIIVLSFSFQFLLPASHNNALLAGIESDLQPFHPHSIVVIIDYNR